MRVNHPIPSGLRSSHLWRLLVHVILLASAFVIFFPILWMISSSLKPTAMVVSYPPRLIPSVFRWANFVDMFGLAPFGRYAWNSAQIVSLNVLGTVLSASLVAFGFARLRFPLRDFWFIIVLSTMMLPSVVTLVPVYVIMSKLGWIDSFKPLVVPSFFGGGAFYIFLLRQFFSTIPFELDDAARVDGCSNWRIYSRILMPLSTSALGIVALFTFVAVYQDFMSPIIYLTSVEKFTLPIGLYYFKAVATAGTFGLVTSTGSYYNFLMAASLVVMLPPILLFFFTQRSFMQGVVITGLKS